MRAGGGFLRRRFTPSPRFARSSPWEGEQLNCCNSSPFQGEVDREAGRRGTGGACRIRGAGAPGVFLSHVWYAPGPPCPEPRGGIAPS
jgi:hypothetical protein